MALKNKRYFISGYLFLTGIETARCFVYILSLPGERKVGLSLYRIVPAALLLAVCIACGWLLFSAWRERTQVERWEVFFAARGKARWLGILSAAGLCLIAAIIMLADPYAVKNIEFYPFFFTPVLTFTTIKLIYGRVLPLCIYATMIGAQTILLFGLIFGKIYHGDLRRDYRRERPWSIVALAALSAISIILIGFSLAMPHLTIQSKLYSSRLAAEPAISNCHLWIWGLAVTLNLFTALVVYKRYASAIPAWVTAPFILSLAFSYLLIARFAVTETATGYASKWDVFYLGNDSLSYIVKYSPTSNRPPVYPLFIEWVSGGKAHDYPGSRPLRKAIEDGQDPLMNVAQAQKIILLLTSLFACWALMLPSRSTLPAILFLAFYEFGSFSPEINHILSETITQAWLFLLLGVFFITLSGCGSQHVRRGLIVAAGAFCAMQYITRPAGIYGGVIFAGILLWVLTREWKTYRLAAGIAVLLAACLALLPSLITYIHTGYLSPSPKYLWARYAFAFQLVQPGDLDDFADEVSKRYMEGELARRELAQREVIEKLPTRMEKIHALVLESNYPTVYPAFQYPEVSAGQKLAITAIVLRRHRLEYASLALEQYLYSILHEGRIVSVFPLWALLIVMIIVAAFIRGWAGFSSMILFCTHLFHLLVIAFYDSPVPRYVLATEFLVLIALAIIVWSLCVTGFTLKRRSVE